MAKKNQEYISFRKKSLFIMHINCISSAKLKTETGAEQNTHHPAHTAGAASSLSRQEIKRTSFSNEVD